MSKSGEGLSSEAEGPTFWDHYKANFEYRFVTTNRFFFAEPTRLARTAVGLVTTGAVARTFGTVSPLRAIISILRPGLGPAGIATLGGVGGTLASAGAHILLNVFLSGIALEAGIALGAAGGALVDTMIWSRGASP